MAKAEGEITENSLVLEGPLKEGGELHQAQNDGQPPQGPPKPGRDGGNRFLMEKKLRTNFLGVESQLEN